VEQHEVDATVAQIAAFERVRPDQIVLGELLEALGLYLARQRPGGGGIVHSTPGYTALVDSAAPLGGRSVPVPLNASGRNDLAGLARAIDADTLAISLINPHNPTGTVEDPAEFDAFVLAAARSTLVVVDEAYLEYDDLERRSAVRLVRQGANVLVFRTFAKAYGLAGLPFGYALTSPALAARLRAAGIGSPHSLSRPALAAASAALTDQTHVARVRAANAFERARVTTELDRLGYAHTDSRANFVFFHPQQSADAVRAAFAKAGVRVARAFPPLGDWVRVAVGTPEENNSVIEVLRTLPRGKPVRPS
jgi:histidinol-phosphate aminotransferase